VELQAGDTLTSFGGLSTADWFAQESLRASAATDGHRFLRAYQEGELWRMLAPLEFGIRAPNGSTRTATISPYTFGNFGGLLNRPYSFRSEGPLTDLGAADLYFINLSAAVIGSDQSRFDAAVDQARSLGSAGMIIDMRASKALGDPRFLNRRLICTRFSSMTFNVPVWSGPDVRTVDSSHYEVDLLNPYCGPMVLMVSAQTLSNGEDFSAQLVGAHRVTVVGRRSAGANGNVTFLMLPGGGVAPFTGMEVRNVDGSVFHGVGIVPQYFVSYTAQDFVEGRDRDLETAIQVLHGQTP
jgi:peptidase S41-like protein